jgi:hypothetical protein
MGFDSFRVELQGGSCSFEKICHKLEKMDGVALDDKTLRIPPSQYYFFSDGKHAIQIEVKNTHVAISCRFTLCHPLSVDRVFLDLVRWLMDAFQMDIFIRDNVQSCHGGAFSLADFEDFSSIVLGYIASRRSEWIAYFGGECLGCRPSEAFERFILPRCVPLPEREA